MRINNNELYDFYKSRRNCLKKQIINTQIMDFLNPDAKKKCITGLVMELQSVEKRLEDLL